MTGEPFWIALAGLLAWPTVVVVLVVIALLFTPPDRRAEVLKGIAEVLRAARGAVERKPPTEAGRPTSPEPENVHWVGGGGGPP